MFAVVLVCLLEGGDVRRKVCEMLYVPGVMNVLVVVMLQLDLPLVWYVCDLPAGTCCCPRWVYALASPSHCRDHAFLSYSLTFLYIFRCIEGVSVSFRFSRGAQILPSSPKVVVLGCLAWSSRALWVMFAPVGDVRDTPLGMM